jgi:hypothetical protein
MRFQQTEAGLPARRVNSKQHKFYCGIDLHARFMYLCLFSDAISVEYRHACSKESLILDNTAIQSGIRTYQNIIADVD